MLLNPSVTALILSSILVSGLTLSSSVTALRIFLRWDQSACTEEQILLESRTYLVSTSFAFAMVLQVLSLILLVNFAERSHTLFNGAMCAAGTLNINEYGFPTLILKLTDSILCGIWLVLNHADNLSVDQPLTRFKFAMVPLITVLILFETFLQFKYFIGMDPDIITSCCGTIFSEEASSAGGDLAHLPQASMRIAFYSLFAIILAAGTRFLKSGKGALPFSIASALFLPVSLASVISFISPAIYELPTHHCPFCFMQKEYFYIGYPLYLSLLTASVAGTAVGVLNPFRVIGRSGAVIHGFQVRLSLVALAGFAVFVIISTYFVLFTNLIM